MTVVRPVREDEWQALRDLRLRALRTDPDAFSTTYEQALAHDEATWRERAAGTDRFRTFVAVEDGALVAMSAGFREEGDDDVADVVSVWTAPEARGRGLGRACIEAVLDWARQHRLTRARLWVVAGNERAASVYAGLGFRPTGTSQPLSDRRPDVTEIELVLDL